MRNNFEDMVKGIAAANEAECDCCGVMAPLTRCWPMGIETYACDQCRGVEPEPDDDEGEP